MTEMKDSKDLAPRPDRPQDEFLTLEHVYRQLALLVEIAPDIAAQEKCSSMVHKMQRDGMPLSEQLRVLAGCIYDGLSHGNWPWRVRREGETSVDQYGRL